MMGLEAGFVSEYIQFDYWVFKQD